MTQYQSRLQKFYRLVLRLYPARFRASYAEEMLLIFKMQLIAFPDLDLRCALRIVWQELRPLPALLVTAHIRERSNLMKTNLERWFIQPQGSRKEFLLAVMPFLIMGVLPGLFSLTPAIRDLPLSIGLPILIFLALMLVILGMIGLFVKLPRWSFIYAGILLTLFSLGAVFLLYQFGPPLTISSNWSILFNNAILLSIHLILLFILVAAILGIGGKIPLTREFSNRLRKNPKQISYMLYGGAFLLLLFNYEDVSGVDIYLILSSIAMILGAWMYLRTNRNTTQLAALIAAVTVAAFFSLIANLTLVHYTNPPVVLMGLSVPRVSFFVGLSWLVAIAMVSFPLLIFRSSSQVEA